MVWTGSARRDRLPSDWPQIVSRIKKRDGGRCKATLDNGRRCPRKDVQVDHIIPGDDHRDANLQCLCEFHHGKKSSAEGHAAKAKYTKIKPRQQGRHPGTLK